MQREFRRFALGVVLIAAVRAAAVEAADDPKARLETIVDSVVSPLMAHYAIPGMAVGIVVGRQRYVYDYGVASKATGAPVTDGTLFEIGSDSKTFTATLAVYAELGGQLSLADPVSRYVPALRGSAFDQVSLLNLGTHTAGGLPLQVPDQITNDAQLFAYYQAWRPAHTPGTERTYSNPSIGLLGRIAARSMHGDFATLMQGMLFPKLGLQHTYLEVPSDQAANYAQGYTAKDVPIRLAPGVLAAEAYGVRTTAGDLLRFVEANLGTLPLEDRLQRAILATHTSYYQVGPMTQDLIWEQYALPVPLADLLSGNSPRMAFESNSAAALDPPRPPRDDVLINKTGSTNGFSSYVAFAPKEGMGVVLLANKSYSIEARVRSGYSILRELGLPSGPGEKGEPDSGRQ